MFEKNFILIILGQIISLFGNAILRFALPLHLLGKTDSAMLFGMVSACSFVPMILLCPVGGIIADRINKRNIMVILDFSTAAITFLFSILLGKMDLTTLILIMLILLYGISGTYQPAVQASIPLLLSKDELVKGNAAINLVSSLSSLTGPVIGGAVYGFWGLYPILYVSILCFAFSAIMELFIKIPYEKHAYTGHIFRKGFSDLKESILFIKKQRPVIWKISLLSASANLFLSSLIIIAIPVIITRMLGFSEKTGNQLYGCAQGAIAAGCLAGGLLAGIFAQKQKARFQYLSLIIASAALLPIGAGLLIALPDMAIYAIIIVCCFVMCTVSSFFSIQMISYLQLLTPEHMLGKVTSCAMCICMCASPIGQAVYGVLLENIKGNISFLFIGVFIIISLITLQNRKIFHEIDKLVS